MIAVRLSGGLGNQFFQYALARHLAEIHRTLLKLDISEYETYTLHKYSLRPFNIQEKFICQKEIAQMLDKKPGLAERVLGMLGRPSKSAPAAMVKEKYFHFDPDILKLPDNICLCGYWQSEKYFTGISEIIRREFTVKFAVTGQNRKLAEEISSCESVSLHIRRGDYVTDIRASQVYKNIPLDYYFRSVEYLAERVKDPQFFIFSDDPKWAHDNLRLSYPMTIVDGNGVEKNYEDLRLMSQCRYNIITNSTFSWWAAWLNQNSKKIVLAPKHWFKRDDYYTIDLMPEGWIRL